MGGIPAWVDAVAGVALVAAGAVATYFTGKRSTSGSIDTSEPGQLWAEGAALRKALVDETERLRTQIDELQKEVTATRAENAALRAEIQAARTETETYRQQLRGAHQDLARTEAELENALRGNHDS